MAHELILAVAFNTIIGVSYLAVTGILVPGLKVPDVDLPLPYIRFRRLGYNGILWPAGIGWVVLSPKVVALVLKACMVLFFIGCGSHHLHLAYRGVASEVIASQITHHAILFNFMQVVGAPGAVILAYYIRLRMNRER